MSQTQRMYKENVKSINWFVGCNHNCIYCGLSFQRQMKRQRKRCELCYNYIPHSHLERLLKPPPKTSGKEFVFFPSSGDPAYAKREEWKTAIAYTKKYYATTFLIQSKNPICFLQFEEFPSNVILGTTIETDLTHFFYLYYDQISHAPSPRYRIDSMRKLTHKRKEVTIEPILNFDQYTFPAYIKLINPEFVYVGYDNHNCRLPEPSLADTQSLIQELEKFTEVRVKSLRRAWWEQ